MMENRFVHSKVIDANEHVLYACWGGGIRVKDKWGDDICERK